MAELGEVNTNPLEQQCINAIRVLSIDAIEKANSGHPGAPMGLATVAYVLWTRHLRHNPQNPDWYGRDRFVLSCGHASMLLYSLLHLSGYDVTLEDIKRFRQLGSRTPGHPEYGHTPGVETTTGPLGQGIATAVGMALATAHLGAVFNKPDHTVVDHRTYFIASDGDLMEGISHEAASFAGNLKLGNLIGFFDDNRITIDGATDLSCSDDVVQRFEAYGWQVLKVENGNDPDEIDNAIDAAKDDARPSLIVVRTHIGFGSPNKQDTSSSHGAALGEDEVRLTKKNLDWPSEVPFEIPEDVLEVWREAKTRGASYQQEWEERFAKYESAYDADAAELKRRLEGKLPVGWSEGLPAYNPEDGKVATRKASGAALSALGEKIPELIGGSADLAGSVMTKLSGTEDLTAANHAGRMMYFGVREHAMTAVMNGMALHGGVRPFGGTFLIFADYMRPAIRLAAMMNQPAIYLLSHDSIGLGEDGPTHQPVETLASLRAIPNLVVLRPADGNEVVSAWKIALERNDGPTAIVLTRQGLPVLDRKEFAGLENVSKGGYVLAGGDKKPDVILMASGSEIELAIKARRSLAEDGIEASVVNMVSMEIFAAQPMQYRDLVLPPEVAARVAVEAAHPMPWYQWIGSGGSVVGLDGFGASGPASELFEHFGLTAERVVSKARAALGR